MAVRRLIKVLCSVKYNEQMPSKGCELTPDTSQKQAGHLRGRYRRANDPDAKAIAEPGSVPPLKRHLIDRTTHLNQLRGQVRTGACPGGLCDVRSWSLEGRHSRRAARHLLASYNHTWSSLFARFPWKPALPRHPAYASLLFGHKVVVSTYLAGEARGHE